MDVWMHEWLGGWMDGVRGDQARFWFAGWFFGWWWCDGLVLCLVVGGFGKISSVWVDRGEYFVEFVDPQVADFSLACSGMIVYRGRLLSIEPFEMRRCLSTKS